MFGGSSDEDAVVNTIVSKINLVDLAGSEVFQSHFTERLAPY